MVQSSVPGLELEAVDDIGVGPGCERQRIDVGCMEGPVWIVRQRAGNRNRGLCLSVGWVRKWPLMRLFWWRKVNVVTGVTRKSGDSGVGWQGREEFEGFVVMCQQGGFGRFGVCFLV
jgi:hypothetical protein